MRILSGKWAEREVRENEWIHQASPHIPHLKGKLLGVCVGGGGG